MYRSSRTAKLLRTVNKEPWASEKDHEQEPPRYKPVAKAKSLERKVVVSSRLSPPPNPSVGYKGYPSPAQTNGSNSSSQREMDSVTLDDAMDDDDVNADPIGSSDDEVQITKPSVTLGANGFVHAQTAAKTGSVLKKEPPRLKVPAGNSQESRRNVRGADKDKDAAKFKKPSTSQESGRSSPGSGVKRGFHKLNVEDKDEHEVEDDPLWVTEPKKSRKEGPNNIHARSGRQGKVIPPRRTTAYGRRATEQRNQQQRTKSGSVQARESASARNSAKAPAFKAPDTGIHAESQANNAIFTALDEDFSHLQPRSSSPLSSARSSPAPDEDRSLDHISSEPYETTVECAFCGHRVDKFLYEDFQDQHHLASSGLLFKWKRRFCQFHKRHEAHATWRDRSYPTIDWSSLPRRMRRHNTYLVDVLRGRVASHYRDAMCEQVKPGLKGTHQAFNAAMEDSQRRPGTSAGYYGPKGQKMMMDHIIQNLSDDIRSAAKRDKLVASSGVQGGVSGFVQAVLVPHLAELLIREDLDLVGEDSDNVSWSDRAKEVITESGEVGEILWPEEKEAVAEVVDLAND